MSSFDQQFRLLYEENYNALCKAAYRILREQDTAREIVQDVFVELLNKENWHLIKSPKGYLYMAVYNRSLNWLSKRKRFVSEESIPLHKHATENHSIEHDELKKIIIESIASLPKQCQIIFLLSREESMTYAQIAAHLRISVKTVEHQMGIALKKIRNYLKSRW